MSGGRRWPRHNHSIQYAASVFEFVVDVMRWENRLSAYAGILATDDYPPFMLGQ